MLKHVFSKGEKSKDEGPKELTNLSGAPLAVKISAPRTAAV